MASSFTSYPNNHHSKYQETKMEIPQYTVIPILTIKNVEVYRVGSETLIIGCEIRAF